MPRPTFGPTKTALVCALLLLPQGCFVYSEELLDNDAVSFGAGAPSGASTQRKLQVFPPSPPAEPPIVESEAGDAAAGDTGTQDAGWDAGEDE